MTMRSKFAMATLLTALVPALAFAAANAKADQDLVGFNAMKLTAAQQRSVYRGIGDAQEVTAPAHYMIYVGGKVPDSIKLQPLPPAATKQTPKVTGDDYVKLDEGEVLLVKPQSRTIVEVIDHYHGTVAAQAG